MIKNYKDMGDWVEIGRQGKVAHALTSPDDGGEGQFVTKLVRLLCMREGTMNMTQVA
jgi:hypothetical protein